jgi:FkbM family methyltransferase
METIFDVGMYDGADAKYYLETGHKVVAIEANPMMCDCVGKKLQRYVDTGQLLIENVAVAANAGSIDLHICGQDLGSSSIVAEHLVGRQPLASFSVPATTITDLMHRHGKPKFLKVDIEGADKVCVMSLTQETAPQYLSFEAHKDMEEMIDYAASIGYCGFKIIHQNSFLCVQRQYSLGDRIRRKIMRLTGYDAPTLAKRDGRQFALGHSAGPAPWRSDGPFYSRAEILSAWRRARSADHVQGWYDVHAALS